ncbi:hypothetical protein GCM10027090_40330 [Sinomonas soli]
MPASARTRASGLRASGYKVQLSRISSHVSDPKRTLARRNLPVVSPDIKLGESIGPSAVSEALAQHLHRFGRPPTEDLLVALRWTGEPDYPRLRVLVEALAKPWWTGSPPDHPCTWC